MFVDPCLAFTHAAALKGVCYGRFKSLGMRNRRGCADLRRANSLAADGVAKQRALVRELERRAEVHDPI
jgi:hypothetical protein